MKASIKKEHFAVFVDWVGTLHIQFRVREKFLDCLKVNGRGISIVSIKRRKAEQRGVRMLPPAKQLEILQDIRIAASERRVSYEVRDLLTRIHEVTTVSEAGTTPGCPVTSAANTAITTQAGANPDE